MKYGLLLLSLLGSLVYSNAQTFEWVKQIAGNSQDTEGGMHVDSSGNVYLTGEFLGTIDLDPGPGVANQTVSGSNGVFVAKYDSDGDFIWGAHVSAGNYNNSGYDIATDGDGNVYCTGSFFGAGNFDPGGTDTSAVSNGQMDGFIVKYNSVGDFQWVQTFGGTGTERFFGVVDQMNNNIVVSGIFQNTVDMDPGTGVLNFTAQNASDVFLSEFSPQGDLVYAKHILGSANMLVDAMAKDQNDNLVLSGYFGGVVDFDPGPGIYDIASISGSDGYIAKYDGDGNLSFVKTFPTDGWGEVYCVATDTSGNIYGTGSMQGTTNFDPGVSDTTLFSNGDGTFAIKLSPNGDFEWVSGFPCDTYLEMNGIDVDNMERSYISGYIIDDYDFSQSVNGDTLYCAGSADAFIVKLDQDGSYLWSRQFSGNSSALGYDVYVDDDYSVISMGVFQELVDFNLETGPDTLHSLGSGFNLVDIYLHKISQCAPAFYTDSIITCDSLLWSDGNTYASDTLTDYTYYLTAEGCDSLVRLDLSLNYSTTGTDVISACDSYTWIDGNTYTSSNSTALFTINNATGCDSVVTLNLTLNTTPNATITQNGNQLEASPTGMQYQWVECPTFTEINGETNAIFNASNGEYAVIIDDAGCMDTSECFVYSDAGLTTLLSESFSIFPNPNNGSFSIESNNNEAIEVTIITVSGEIIQHDVSNGANAIQLHVASGSYFIEITSQSTRTVRKLVII